MPILHYFHLSQPSRAIKTLLAIGEVDAEIKSVNLMEGEHKTEEFLKINKWGAVPCWEEDDGTVLVESNSIMRYLADKHEIHSVWPKDLLARQRVDAALDFCGTTFRPGTIGLLHALIVLPKLYKQDLPDEARLEEIKTGIKATLEKAEKWLGDNAYFAGDFLSLADLQISSEVDSNLTMMKFPLDDFPKFKTWYGRVLENEHVKADHDILMEIASKMG